MTHTPILVREEHRKRVEAFIGELEAETLAEHETDRD